MTTVAEAPATRAYLNRALRHPEIKQLIASGRRLTTAHDDGHIVWHEWGAGPVLVMLHGGFGAWLHWVRNIEAMARHFRVLAPDLPGLGESDPIGVDLPDAAAVARPLLAGLRDLAPGEDPLRVVGFSLGSVVGSQLAVGLGSRAATTVLIGPSGLGDLWRNVTSELKRRHPEMTEEERRATIRHNLLHSMIADVRNIDDMALDIQSDLTGQKRRLIGLPISMSTALADAIPKLVPRLTILWGEHDGYLYPDVRSAAAILEQRYPGLRVGVIDGAGHWACYEAATVVNRLLLDCLMPKEDGEV